MGRYNKVRSKNGKLVLSGCSEYIDRILDMAGIYTIAKVTHLLKKQLKL